MCLCVNVCDIVHVPPNYVAYFSITFFSFDYRIKKTEYKKRFLLFSLLGMYQTTTFIFFMITHQSANSLTQISV